MRSQPSKDARKSIFMKETANTEALSAADGPASWEAGVG